LNWKSLLPYIKRFFGKLLVKELLQESRAAARKPCDAAAVLFELNFANAFTISNIGCDHGTSTLRADRQTDKQTDGQYSALRGKNRFTYANVI